MAACWIWAVALLWRSALYRHNHDPVCRSGGAYRRFMMHCALMLLFSAPFTGAANKRRQVVRHFACRPRLNAAMRRFCWLPSDPRRGAWRGGHRALVQAVLAASAGDFRRAYATLLTVVMILSCSGSVGAVAGIGFQPLFGFTGQATPPAPCVKLV